MESAMTVAPAHFIQWLWIVVGILCAAELLAQSDTEAVWNRPGYGDPYRAWPGGGGAQSQSPYAAGYQDGAPQQPDWMRQTPQEAWRPDARDVEDSRTRFQFDQPSQGGDPDMARPAERAYRFRGDSPSSSGFQGERPSEYGGGYRFRPLERPGSSAPAPRWHAWETKPEHTPPPDLFDTMSPDTRSRRDWPMR